jgi:hypothetical protein
MFNLFKKIISKGETTNSSPVEFEFIGNIKFTLKIRELHIGYLSIEDSQWVFRYSEEFKAQKKYARLTGFSDLNKVYSTQELWPFFKIRIPGLKQPMIRDIIKAENLDDSNEAVLLKRFGRESMSNPYILESA